MVSRPGEMLHYRAYSVLWQMACDIELLHKVQSKGMWWQKCIKTCKNLEKPCFSVLWSLVHDTWYHTAKTCIDKDGKSLVVVHFLISVCAGAMEIICDVF